MGTTAAIILGSHSDWPTIEPCYHQLQEFEIDVEVQVLSAHRTPDKLREYVLSAEDRVGVFIAAAGMAAALPGAVAAYTIRPVIGIPVASAPLQGIDSLLSMVQMPPGVPVATVAIGSAGARNAAILAAQILAPSVPKLRDRLKNFKSKQAESVDKNCQALQERLRGG
ncbi:MAG TPA: 5-(carboxyamino)imidazole ribonucleotide mutase [Phycisphaerae bacterium]|nr:5-(carboxyamino)imidazole ribonucleotide mutase [Phycisphaerae bacterium]HOJ72771.1 5-(carboxyamino)imidazole ribonucleotide mutase [Phycisphaerae bacterium]HOM51802.1 5-(carboxyamino)imidazole ribonucleotide mutase [Phycisphaerae bacterium]HON65206.1 5-(carboxyamino)imidazole ribonucleotide mutase [Phycisphaerae bacterium]HOQ84380.1 5-(carboxyamino)imidazole ribonucleotide mutase [Phycisphaerae bacterium]